MKRLTLLCVGTWLLMGCEEKSMNDDSQEPEHFTFTSVNVKTEGTQYFNFSTNEGTTTEPESWDIAFGVVPVTVEIAPCQYMTISDPVIMTGEEITMAVVDTADLEDVMDPPSSVSFFGDSDAVALIGKNWLAADFSIYQDTYALRTCAGDYAALQFQDYTYTSAPLHQLVDITWTYKYDSDGSSDLSDANIDTFVASGSYDEPTYFAFGSEEVSDGESWDIKVDGYEIWLGNGVAVQKLSDTSLGEITEASSGDYSTDALPFYVTSGWYDYGEGHVLAPKDLVYIVNTADGKYPSLKIFSYYDDQGESGTFTMEWKYLAE
ncbi:MAG: HmuY family protein [Candidatus Neomarinimicrobiota bacterium]